MLRFLLNLLWFVLGGFVMGLGWWLAGLVAAISIIGIPWARACFVIGTFSFWPFGYEAVSRRDQRELRAALGLPPQVRGPHAARARALAHFLGRAVVEGEGEGGEGGRARVGGSSRRGTATQTPPSLVGVEDSVMEGARACESDEDSTVLDAPFEPGELQACVQRLIRRSLTVMEATLRDGRGDRTAVELAKWMMTEGREALTVSEADPKAMAQLAELLNMVKE